MEPKKPNSITVKAKINAPVERVWKVWTSPDYIMKWNSASEEWHTPKAVNDLKAGGKFNYRMEAKDGSMGFDFEGVYDEVITFKMISYSLGDARKVKIVFTDLKAATEVSETFDAENENPVELQRGGWQAILNNFKKVAEGQ